MKNIGVTTAITENGLVTHSKYPEYIKNAGYNPVIITPDTDPTQSAELLDGLVVIGGIDVHPAIYGHSPDGSINSNLQRDEHELELIHEFLVKDKKVFGICRGFQLLAVYFNLSLVQHINNHSQNIDDFQTGDPYHPIQIIDDSLLDKYKNNNEFYVYDEIHYVNSFHHQAVIASEFKDNENLILNAYTYANKKLVICESFSWDKLAFGVQWHPERSQPQQLSLLQNFMEDN